MKKKIRLFKAILNVVSLKHHGCTNIMENYYSYPTENTHKLCYAVGDTHYGPFVYQGVIFTPIVDWITHHAVEYKRKQYLFHHDCVPLGGKTWLRSLKVVKLEYNPSGKINIV